MLISQLLKFSFLTFGGIGFTFWPSSSNLKYCVHIFGQYVYQSTMTNLSACKEKLGGAFQLVKTWTSGFTKKHIYFTLRVMNYKLERRCSMNFARFWQQATKLTKRETGTNFTKTSIFGVYNITCEKKHVRRKCLQSQVRGAERFFFSVAPPHRQWKQLILRPQSLPWALIITNSPV